MIINLIPIDKLKDGGFNWQMLVWYDEGKAVYNAIMLTSLIIASSVALFGISLGVIVLIRNYTKRKNGALYGPLN
ncbi:MAG: hypothetical protein EZS28_007512 [Streblomastix strix]|uniref:Uncharacterized protein n=1 Tax=Streblomastix strix TaxID=222440 RepID=A0A5J4WPN7_9EUKA|nr:MAG: hypothetical protein EZS28_007512 [Streblomastix strix]